MRNGEAANGQIQKSRQALPHGGLLRRDGKITDALRIGADVYLEFIHIHITQSKHPAHQLLWADAGFHFAGRYKGSFAGGFRAVNYEFLHGDLEKPGLEAEVGYFHMTAGKGFEPGNYPAFHYMLEP